MFLIIAGDTCSERPSKVTTIYGVAGTIRLLAGISLAHDDVFEYSMPICICCFFFCPEIIICFA